MHLIDRLKSATPLICGHRGNMLHSPENTLASLRSAAAAGAQLCEIDVQTTSDGEFVLMHDLTLERTTNGTGFVHRTAAHQIAGLDAGSWFGPGFAGEPVPTLRAVLDLAGELGIGLVIEIKQRHADDAWIAGLADQIQTAGMTEAVAISSFDHPQLKRLKSVAPHLKTIGIVHHRPVDAVALVHAAQLDGLVVDFPMFHIDDARDLRRAGVWVVYAPPRPQVFGHAARHDVAMADDLETLLGSGLIDFVVGDDVGWLVGKAAIAG